MSEDEVKDIIFSFIWYGHSAFHTSNLLEVLKQRFPDSDWRPFLDEMREIRDKQPGPGDPRWIPGNA